MHWRLWLLLLTPWLLRAQISGVVRDANTGETLCSVEVRLSGGTAPARTDAAGRFRFSGLEPGNYELQIATVGYRLLRLEVSVGPGVEQQLEIALMPETLRRKDSVEVAAGPYGAEPAMAVGLEGAELRNLGSVLADDPLRAAQAMPGVSGNDDYRSEFAIRGAGFRQVGVYLDGVLLHTPFHAVQGEAASASLTMLNGDLLEVLHLYPGPVPPRYEDRTAAALDLRSRNGSRSRLLGRTSAGFSNANFMLEGPLHQGRGSWILAARKSYLQYLIGRATDENNIAFGFWDAQGRFAYDLRPDLKLTLSAISGASGLNRSGAENRSGLNAVLFSDSRLTLLSAGAVWAPSSKAYFSQKLAWMQEDYENLNRDRRLLAEGGYREWIWNGDATASWTPALQTSAGWSLRRVSSSGLWLRLRSGALPSLRLEEHHGDGLRTGAYTEQRVSLWGQRIQAVAGGRVDRFAATEFSCFSPFASLAVRTSAGGTLQLGWGHAAQFPELNQMHSIHGRVDLLPERAVHAQASYEHRLADGVRLRLEVFQRNDRDLIFRPWLEPRRLNGKFAGENFNAPLENSPRGRARGIQLVLQRRSANGVNGWVSYQYAKTTVYDGILRLRFPSDYDERHSLHLYAARRFGNTVNLNLRHRYGSGFPVPGFFMQWDGRYSLAAARNVLRLPAYHRTDVRLNKVFVRDRHRLTLYLEVVNLLNHRNVRFQELRSVNLSTGEATLAFDRLMPVLPSAGLSLEF